MSTLSPLAVRMHIANNQLKSVLLLATFPVLLLFMVGALTGLMAFATTPPGVPFGLAQGVAAGVEGVRQYGTTAIGGALVWFVISFVANTYLMNWMTGARPVDRAQAPQLYAMLERLSATAGMAAPKLQIIDTPALNAFASGMTQGTYAVTLTTGLVRTLPADELEAVMAHELSHIKHHDVRLLMVSVVFVGMLSVLSEMVFYKMRAGLFRGNNRKTGLILVLGLVVLIVGRLLATGIRFALSRRREYMADAGAVAITKNPDAMIRALQRISGNSAMDVPDEAKQMFIDNPPAFGGLLRTHPRIEDRVHALELLKTEAPARRGPWSR